MYNCTCGYSSGFGLGVLFEKDRLHSYRERLLVIIIMRNKHSKHMPLHILNDLHPPNCQCPCQNQPDALPLRLSLRNPIHSIASHDHPNIQQHVQDAIITHQYSFSPWLSEPWSGIECLSLILLWYDPSHDLHTPGDIYYLGAKKDMIDHIN